MKSVTFSSVNRAFHEQYPEKELETQSKARTFSQKRIARHVLVSGLSSFLWMLCEESSPRLLRFLSERLEQTLKFFHRFNERKSSHLLSSLPGERLIFKLFHRGLTNNREDAVSYRGWMMCSTLRGSWEKFKAGRPIDCQADSSEVVIDWTNSLFWTLDESMGLINRSNIVSILFLSHIGPSFLHICWI